jgi:hypothetical protein
MTSALGGFFLVYGWLTLGGLFDKDVSANPVYAAYVGKADVLKDDCELYSSGWFSLYEVYHCRWANADPLATFPKGTPVKVVGVQRETTFLLIGIRAWLHADCAIITIARPNRPGQHIKAIIPFCHLKGMSVLDLLPIFWTHVI